MELQAAVRILGYRMYYTERDTVVLASGLQGVLDGVLPLDSDSEDADSDPESEPSHRRPAAAEQAPTQNGAADCRGLSPAGLAKVLSSAEQNGRHPAADAPKPAAVSNGVPGRSRSCKAPWL